MYCIRIESKQMHVFKMEKKIKIKRVRKIN